MIYRQGDVLIISATMPKTATEAIDRDAGRVVLAYGEVTGHAHAIKTEKAALFRDPKLAAIFLHVTGDEPALLEHEEHTTIAIPPGQYRVIRQVEYTPQATRQVAD